MCMLNICTMETTYMSRHMACYVSAGSEAIQIKPWCSYIQCKAPLVLLLKIV